MTEERKIESYASHTGGGYRLEWKISSCSDSQTPQARAMRAAIEGLMGGYVSHEWQQGPYSLHSARARSDQLTPFISTYDSDLIDMGLCRRATAEAVLACLKSKHGDTWVWHLIDWRISVFHYERKWEIWREKETE